MRRIILIGLAVLVLTLVGCKPRAVLTQSVAYAASENGIDPTVTLTADKASVSAINELVIFTSVVMVPTTETQTAIGVTWKLQVPSKFVFVSAGIPATFNALAITVGTPGGTVTVGPAFVTSLTALALTPDASGWITWSIGDMVVGASKTVSVICKYTG